MKNVEQLSSDLSLHLDQDVTILKRSEIDKILLEYLKCENLVACKHGHATYYMYKAGTKTIVFVLAQITYLGHPHPIFKKRIQLKPWYKDVMDQYREKDNFEFKTMGFYYYKGNTIFVEFQITNSDNRNWNNSSAHVYTNDLYQAMKNGVFKKVDANENVIIAIQGVNLQRYFDDKVVLNKLFNIFANFNNCFPFGRWLSAMDMINKLYIEGSKQWNQAEWPGWLLEHEFEKFTTDEGVLNYAKYISNKGGNKFDFDIYFGEEDFYGDLKASDQSQFEAPANDQAHFIECITRHDKFWYILYEHETIKDTAEDGYLSSQERNQFRYDHGGWPKTKEFDPFSYSKKLKKAVKFNKMYIIELNRINFREVLNDFHQGHQPTGESRAIKFKIDKRNIDNFVVYRHTFQGDL